MHRTRIYTIHEHPDLPDVADRVELLHEGFSLTAFLFHILWLIYYRLWIPALTYLCLLAALGYVAETLALSAASLGLLQILLQVLLAFVAQDLRRWYLTRRGYNTVGVVAAENELSAQRRYYDVLA